MSAARRIFASCRLPGTVAAREVAAAGQTVFGASSETSSEGSTALRPYDHEEQALVPKNENATVQHAQIKKVVVP